MSIKPRPPFSIVLSSLISNVSTRPPALAQQTLDAAAMACLSAGTVALEPLTWLGAQTVSPSPRLMKALPALLRETMFSTEAMKP